jgi:microcystin-dependent protein
MSAPKYKPLDFDDHTPTATTNAVVQKTTRFSAWWQSYSYVMMITLFGFFVLGVIIWVKWNSTGHEITGTDRTLDALILLFQNMVLSFETGLQEAYDKLFAVNASISSDIVLIEIAINDTNADTQAFLIDITSRIAMVQALLDTKVSTLETVLPDPVNMNVELVANNGIIVTPGNAAHTVHVINTGVVEITSPDGSVNVNITDGMAVLYYTGICTITSVPSDSVNRNLNLVGDGMLVITTDSNTATITIDGTTLYNAIIAVAGEIEGHAIELAELQNTTVQQQQQINTLLSIGEMSEESLNGTLSSVNMTFIQLVMAIVALENQLTALETQVAQLSQQGNGTGIIMVWSGNENSTSPTGWLLCDGTQYNITDYADLYAVIGDSYCATPCVSGRFAVPDLRGTVPAGKSSSGSSVLNVAVGTTVGGETVALSSSTIPSHAHGGSAGPDGDHAHGTSTVFGTNSIAYIGSPDYGTGGAGIWLTSSFGNPDGAAINDNYEILNSASGGHFGIASLGLHSHSLNTDVSGSSTSHNNVQPSVVMHYIIKT